MNYLLVMPKHLGTIDHFNIFPIGLAYVSASMKEAGFNVVAANLDYLEGTTYELLQKLIVDNDIDAICTGGLSRDYSKLKDIIDTAREIEPHIMTIVGGGIISSDPESAMEALNADIGVIGEGEHTMCDLAEALDKSLPYDAIHGLIYKDKDNFVRTAVRQEIADINALPYPDFDGFGYGNWVRMTGSGLVLTDRSCPFQCTFCFHPTGEKYRQRSLDSIFNEIEYQVSHFGVQNIGLSTELFATSKGRVEAFCKRIRQLNITWSCSLRVSDVDAPLLNLMKESGCTSIVFGLESADNSVLKSMRKGTTVAQIKRALELTYDANIMIEAGFIFGDINETRQTIETTINFWREHNTKHYLNLTMIYVFPGSYLYQYACDNGIITDRVQFLRDGCPLINISKLNDVQYKELHSIVTELRLHPHVPAGTFEIVTVDEDGGCYVDFSCRKCGHYSSVMVPFWFGKEVRCPSCSLTNFIDPFEKAVHQQTLFSKVMAENNLIALWGAGGIYYKLSRQYHDLVSSKFILTDANKSTQGLTLCGKEVLAPETIQAQSVKTVIITALSRKDEIRAAIRSNYPSVEHIFIPAFDITPHGIVPILNPI